MNVVSRHVQGARRHRSVVLSSPGPRVPVAHLRSLQSSADQEKKTAKQRAKERSVGHFRSGSTSFPLYFF